MLESELRLILLRFYFLGFISIIITPSSLFLLSEITVDLNDTIRILINGLWFIIGYYLIPTSTFWVMDLKPIIINQFNHKDFKKHFKVLLNKYRK